MIRQSFAHKRYHSAGERFLPALLKRFFRTELPKMFGPVLLNRVVDELIALINYCIRPKDSLRPGQVLWCAVDKNTRADSPHCRLVPVVLTLTAPEDSQRLSEGVSMSIIAQDAIARICREAYAQGALLSMRDIALLTWHCDSHMSVMRKGFEQRTQTTLPHTGTLQDMGSCISHKTMIVHKVIVEKKDPRVVARETCHRLEAVEAYVGNFRRVELCYEKRFSVEEIYLSTGIAKHVVRQYIDILKSLKRK